MRKIYVSIYWVIGWRSARWPLALISNCVSLTGSRVTLELRRGCWVWFSGRRTTPHLEWPLDYPFRRGWEGIATPLKSSKSQGGGGVSSRRLPSQMPGASASGGCWILRWLDRAHPSLHHVGLTHAQDRHKLWFLHSDFVSSWKRIFVKKNVGINNWD